MPLKLTLGVKVTVPLAFKTAVPPAPLVTLAMVSVLPSTSESLPSSCAAVKETGADFYEAEVDDAVAGLSSLMEPVIMAVLGVLIGGMVIAMYLPIFKMGQVV